MKYLALLLPLNLAAQCAINPIEPYGCSYINEIPSIMPGETVTRCYVLTPERPAIVPGFISVQSPGCGPVSYSDLTYELLDDTCGLIVAGEIYPPGANPVIFGLDTNLTYTLCFTWTALCEQSAVCATYYLSNLPVELISFSGDVLGDRILLKWSTGSENGSSHFSVRRSTDLYSWKLLGVVGAAGSSHAIQQYTLVDRSPARGVQYYVLDQVDLDGSVMRYTTIAVNYKVNESPLLLWYNLAGQRIR